MFEIRKFDKAKEMPLLNKWCEEWKMSSIPEWFLPENNFIIDDVIFASMYKSDSQVVWMENIISNIHCPSKTRIIALGKMGEHIFQVAREMGAKACLGWTSNKSVSKTSEEHGFTLTDFNHACMVKLL